MFEENKTLVTDEVTENVEQTTEEIVENVVENDVEKVEEPAVEEKQGKMFTETELEEIKLKAKRNAERKVRRELEKKYSRVETVLNAGLGTSDISEATDKLEGFYKQKGIEIPSTPRYSERETKILAEAEANEIISSGYEEIVEEVDRLADIGVENMTAQDKLIFSKLASERQRIEDERDLNSIGVSKLDDEFNEFAEKLNPNMSLKEKYEMYLKFKPKKQVETIGSMQSGQPSKVKEHYTADEIARLTEEDLDNPKIWEAVRRSMTGQS